MIDFHVCSTQCTKTGPLAIIRDSPPRRDKIPSLLPMILCCSCCCSPTSFSIKSILLTTLPLFWSGSLFLVSFISTSSKHPPDSLILFTYTLFSSSQILVSLPSLSFLPPLSHSIFSIFSISSTSFVHFLFLSLNDRITQHLLHHLFIPVNTHPNTLYIVTLTHPFLPFCEYYQSKLITTALYTSYTETAGHFLGLE